MFLRQAGSLAQLFLLVPALVPPFKSAWMTRAQNNAYKTCILCWTTASVCVCLCVCALQWKHARKILTLLHAHVQICNSCLDQQQLQCAHLYGMSVVNTPSRNWLSMTALLPDKETQLDQQANWSLLCARTCAAYLATKTSYRCISTPPHGHEDCLEHLTCYWMPGNTLIYTEDVCYGGISCEHSRLTNNNCECSIAICAPNLLRKTHAYNVTSHLSYFVVYKQEHTTWFCFTKHYDVFLIVFYNPFWQNISFQKGL